MMLLHNSPSVLRRVMICVVVGAAFQYAVAAALSMRQTLGVARYNWQLEVEEGNDRSSLFIYERLSTGRNVLSCGFTFVNNGSIAAAPASSMNWSRADWSHEYQTIDYATGLVISEMPGKPPPWSRFATIRSEDSFKYYPAQASASCIEVACGWPARSASYFATGTLFPPGPYSVREGLTVANAVTQSSITPRVIPLRIFWPGALINTLLYASGLFVPLTVFTIARRHLRRRAARCPNCNYDLRATTTGACPECGAAVTIPAAPR